MAKYAKKIVDECESTDWDDKLEFEATYGNCPTDATEAEAFLNDQTMDTYSSFVRWLENNIGLPIWSKIIQHCGIADNSYDSNVTYPSTVIYDVENSFGYWKRKKVLGVQIRNI